MASTKQNTPGLGIEYEVHLPAYFALLLNTNPEIEDFKLRSNVQGFGNLDDLLVDIKTRGGENLYFAFQLKHKEKSSNHLLPTNFEARGDFNLEKYCEAFKQLNEENRKKYHFILYTNKNFDCSRTNEVQKFDMKQDECCLGRNFFDTGGDGKHLYKFEVNGETGDGKNVNKEDFREFFSKFSLYTGQANIRDLDKSYILNILKFEDCYVKYVDFFRRWHRGDFIDKIIDKKTLNVHLVDVLLSSVAINYHLSDGQDKNSIFFGTMVQQFDITIIDDSKQDFIKLLEENIHKYPEEFNKNSEEELIKLGKKGKLVDKFTKELKEETKLKLLHYFFQKPLILDFQKSSENLIYEAIKLCRIQENEIKLVIVGRGINLSFSHLKIFKDLTEVNGKILEETEKRCNLSLQGRNISFEEIFEDEIREFVTPREIFQMLKGSFSVGEDKEKLPECYIPRTISSTVFDIESIIKHSNGSAAIIFYYKGKFEALKILIQNIVGREDYLYEDFLDDIILRKKKADIPAIILRREGCSRKQFDEICEKLRKEKPSDKETPNVRLFQVLDGKRCLLLSSKNTSFKENYEPTKMSVEENNIHVFFNNSINILCAQAGMGKSTLMKYLKNECDSNFWTVMVDLKAHNQFLNDNHKIEEVLKYFLELEKSPNQFSERIKTMFLRKKKIVFFLDGLDEVEHNCVDPVLEISKLLAEMGFRIWLSSRQNLQQTIEQYLNISVIEINELNKNQQEKYIENRLTSLYSKNAIEEIIDLVFSNTDLVNSCQILEIPLQLYIITQIFLDDKSYYSDLRQNNFILTKMFEIFFEGRYKHYLAKVKLENPHLLGGLEGKLENYEIVALHSLLDAKHFQKLQIKKPTEAQIKNSDCLGIITEINKENKAVFEHMTFAEYFASKFLVKNFDKARILKEEIFTEKYQNLLLIFNIMLAEDSPSHLAIIYKDLSRIQEMGQSSLMDKGGRNFLQVAACVATKHPFLYAKRCKGLSGSRDPIYIAKYGCEVYDQDVKDFRGEDLKIKEIVNFIALSSCEPFKNDKVFEWNSLQYALKTGALYIVEVILEKSETPPNFYKLLGKYYIDEVVAYYSIRFGYHRLFSEILATKSCQVTRINSYLFMELCGILKGCYSILHYIFYPECTNRTRILELLIGDSMNKIVYDENGYTFLHFAVLLRDFWPPFTAMHGISMENRCKVNRTSLEISKFLIEKGADVNVKDKKGKSPLHWAVDGKNLEITKLLVEKGAHINMKDKDEWSPLQWAVDRNNLEMSKLLVEKGADVNIQGKSSDLFPMFLAVHENNLEISKLLVENGADVNIKDKEGKSPLHWAVKRKNFQISKLLLENGVNVNIQDKEGRSPLVYAVIGNNLKLLKLLIEGGADVNCETKRNKTLLSSVRASIRLFRKETNVSEASKTSLVLRLAVENRNFDLAQILIENGAIWDAQIIFDVIERGYSETLDLLLSKGIDLSKVNALHRAAKYNNIDVLNYLIENGADVNVKNDDGFTVLHVASSWGLLDVVEFLLNNPKTAHLLLVPDKKGRTCLHIAVYFGRVQVLGLILKTEIDLDKFDIHNDKYPLHFAAIDGCLQKELLMTMTRVVREGHLTSDKVSKYFRKHPIISNVCVPRNW